MTVVVHLDIDNFYVSVERADNPALSGRPVVVSQGNSGGFVALSAEAKATGLRKGDGVGAQGRSNISSLIEMGSIGVEEARRRCPGLVVLPMRVERYRSAGAAIHAVLRRWGAVEKTSYDDFYIDLTALCQQPGAEGSTEADAEGDGDSSTLHSCRPARTRIWGDADFATLACDLRRGCHEASAMRQALFHELGLVGSVGVGRSKLVARMLSPAAKPDGVLAVCDEDAHGMMCRQPLVSLPGYQAKRGREIVSLIAKALGRPLTGTSPALMTVGDAIGLDQVACNGHVTDM